MSLSWRAVWPDEVGMNAKPHLQGPVVEPQAAGEEAVAVGDLDRVARHGPGTAERAGHDVAPELDVVLRVAHERRVAGRAAGDVDLGDLVLRRREQAKRVVVPHVLFRRERQSLDVVDGLDLIRLDPGGVEFPLVDGDSSDRYRESVS